MHTNGCACAFSTLPCCSQQHAHMSMEPSHRCKCASTCSFQFSGVRKDPCQSSSPSLGQNPHVWKTQCLRVCTTQGRLLHRPALVLSATLTTSVYTANRPRQQCFQQWAMELRRQWGSQAAGAAISL